MTSKQIYLCFLLIFGNILSTHGQNISLQILDASTNEPISDAFIFIQNSSIGTNSDLDGFAQLNTKGISDFELVFTHINYQSIVIPAKQLNQTINTVLLVERPQELQEYVVATKKKNSRKRKKWMRRFEEAFFGENLKRKQMVLLNPEAIWFEESDSLFEAKAIGNLEILNKAMGYRLQFVLEHFSIDKNEDIRYSGKLFFEDIKAELKRPDKLAKLRSQNYNQSRQLFFLSLVQQLPINSENFEFGITQTDSTGSFQYTPQLFEDLVWSRGPQADTLHLSGFLTVIKKAKFVRNFQRNSTRITSTDQNATSFIFSKTDKIILAPNGSILNPQDLEESGNWTKDRISTELPIDYEGGIILSSPSQNTPIVDSLLQYRYRHAPEKIYLHLNQAFYSNREHLWFKGYLVNAIDHRPQTQSKVMYVDLISPSDEIIYTWILHQDKGFSGDFQWSRNQESGTYRLRAYSNYMRNSGSEYFFEKEFRVYDFLTEEVNKPFENNSQPNFNELVVDFFPEGGDIIAGIPSNICFKVSDQKGVTQDISGTIIDENNLPIAQCKTYHNGIGSFSIVPEFGQDYHLIFSVQGKEYKFQLPEIYDKGLSLNINPTKAEQIFIKVVSSDSSSLKGSFLIGHVRGAIFTQMEILQSAQTFQLSKSNLPAGLLHFTLFDGDQRPQAERLIFNDVNSTKPLVKTDWPQKAFYPKRNFSIPIQLDSTLLEEEVDVSASLLNAQLCNIQEAEEDIYSYLLVNSDLPKFIPHLNYYLKYTNAEKRFYLDLILQTQTWRRFKWRQLREGSAFKKEYPAESGFTIAGYTTRKNDSTRVQTEILLNSLDSTFLYNKILTDDQGNFSFSQVPLFDSTTFILQARINKKGAVNANGSVSGDRLVDIQIHPLSRAPKTAPQQPIFKKGVTSLVNSNQIDRFREKSYTDEQTSIAEWSIDLEEVEIVEKRSFTSARPGKGKFYNLDNQDWIPPTAQGTGLLGRLAPRVSYVPGPEGKLIAQLMDWQGNPVNAPVTLYVDGMERMSSMDFLSIPADIIQNIYINGAFISITTRRISRTMEAYLDSGILQYEHPGYYSAREFFIPRYTTNPDQELRTTIQWQPKLQFDVNGKAVLNFTSGQEPIELQLQLQGISASGEIISNLIQLDWK